VTDFDNEKVSAKEAIDLLRLQKHDFLNYMQIISGYLQLGKLDKAQYFVQKAIEDVTRSGTIMGLADRALSMNLLLRVHNAYKGCGVNISLSTGTSLQFVETDNLRTFLDDVIAAIEQIYFNEPEQPQIELDFSEKEKAYYMELSVYPFNAGPFSQLKEKVAEAARRFGFGLGVSTSPETESRLLQVSFSKNSRSGLDVL
jgi:sensor histidine kinase regulating citrate/malate metabolism